MLDKESFRSIFLKNKGDLTVSVSENDIEEMVKEAYVRLRRVKNEAEFRNTLAFFTEVASNLNMEHLIPGTLSASDVFHEGLASSK